MWWAALSLLLVNDNLLKGGGIAPGWLTGKLSDFAFLIVAPVLCAALLPVALPGRRALAVLSVAGLFVVTDLSPAASDAVIATAGRLGMRWRLWPDPTDLIALVVLPIAVRVMRAQPRRSASMPTLLQRERIGAVVGALACLATSDVPEYPHHPFFVNRTDRSVDVRVTWVLSKVDCEVTPETLARALDPGDLDDPRTMQVASGQVAVLDGVPEQADPSPVGQCALPQRDRDQGCVAAILESGRANPVLMVAVPSWTESDDGPFLACSRPPPPVSRCKPRLDPDTNPGPDAVALVASKSETRFDGEGAPAGRDGVAQLPAVMIAPIDLAAILARTPSPEGCRTLQAEYDMLLENVSCASDAECQIVEPALGLDGYRCPTYVNTSVSASEVQAVRTRWFERCEVPRPQCAGGGAHPATCNAGRCDALCPGITIRWCPPSCHRFDEVVGGICINAHTECRNDAGELCVCNAETHKSECAPFPEVAPSCPLTCIDQTMPGTPGSVDAGSHVPTDAAADDDAGNARDL